MIFLLLLRLLWGGLPRMLAPEPIERDGGSKMFRPPYFNCFRASRAPSTMAFSFALATGSDSGTSPQSGAA